MARYYPVSPAFWTDPKARKWDDQAKLLAFYLLTCPHRNLEGLYRLPVSYIRADLGWPQAKLAKALRRLEADGFVERDTEAEVVLICRALKYQAPKSAKQITGALKVLEEVPPSSVHAAFVEAANEYAPDFAQSLSNGVPTMMSKPTQPHSNGVDSK